MFKVKDSNQVKSLVTTDNVLGPAAKQLENFDRLFGSNNIFSTTEVAAVLEKNKKNTISHSMGLSEIKEFGKALLDSKSLKDIKHQEYIQDGDLGSKTFDSLSDDYLFENNWKQAHLNLMLANQAMESLKNHDKTKDIFRKLDELCKERNVSNSNELLEKHSDDPAVSGIFNELNSKISENKDVKRLFKQFESANNEFNNQLSDMKSIVKSDQLNLSPAEAIHKDGVGKYSGDFDKSFKVYDQRVNDIRDLRHKMGDLYQQNPGIPFVDDKGESLVSRHQKLQNEEVNFSISKSQFDVENESIVQKKVEIETLKSSVPQKSKELTSEHSHSDLEF